MKRMTKDELRREAEKIYTCWICRYSARNADKLSLAVRRTFRNSPKTHDVALQSTTIRQGTQIRAGNKRKTQKVG